MITKTRPSKVEIKEERGLKRVDIKQVVIQTLFTLSTLYAAYSLYIYVWRMITGH
jgi:hypothetical protein